MPPGCPFQTRCGYKGEVAGGLCDTEVPPDVTFGGGHRIKCHLSRARLEAMEKVIDMSALPARETVAVAAGT